MGILNLNDLKVGMVLAGDVKNKHGNILIKQGIELTEKHITLLKAWGITEADVAGIDQNQLDREELKALSPEFIEAVESELRDIFPPFDSHPVMAEIYRIARKLRLKQPPPERSEARQS